MRFVDIAEGGYGDVGLFEESTQIGGSLAADPYPRRPGAKLEDVLPRPRGGGRKGPAEQRRHPFARLAALRDKPRRGR